MTQVMKTKYSGLMVAAMVLLTAFSAQSQEVAVRDGKYYGQDGMVFTGDLRSTGTDGRLHSIHTVVAGVLAGPVTYYDESGQVEETGYYADGRKHGVWKQFNASGRQTGEATYVNGQKDGVWTVWDDQGVKRYHMVYSMGRKIDTWQIWDEHSNLVSERVYGN